MKASLHKAIDDLRLLASHGGDTVTCVTPPGWKAPAGFPRGELLCVNAKGERVRLYKSAKILAWCDRTDREIEEQ